MVSNSYSNNVFINCPFDDDYQILRNAAIFAIFDCGFIPRCALEEVDSGIVRFEKIKEIIFDSKFGIHDISRTELDEDSRLPRFNMPLELGVFLGAKYYGEKQQKEKKCLVLDVESYRFQSFISDIAGQNVQPHNNDPEILICRIRDWLNSSTRRRTIPGGREILRRYRQFEEKLPSMCQAVPIEVSELTYNDYTNFMEEWLRENL